MKALVLTALLLIALPAIAEPESHPAPAMAPTPESRPVPKSFWLLSAGTYATAAADYEVTHACIVQGTCREANPLLGSSRPRAYAVGFGVATLTNYLSYRMLKSGSPHWYLPQIVNAGSHGIGLGLTIALKRH